MKLTLEKLEGWGHETVKISRCYLIDRFCMIHPCDKQTDRRTGDSI